MCVHMSSESPETTNIPSGLKVASNVDSAATGFTLNVDSCNVPQKSHINQFYVYLLVMCVQMKKNHG